MKSTITQSESITPLANSLDTPSTNSSDLDVSLPQLGHLSTDNDYDSPDSSEYDTTPNGKVESNEAKNKNEKPKSRHQFQDVSIAHCSWNRY